MKKSLNIQISKNESYTIYSDGVFHSNQDNNKFQCPRDIPQYLFEIRDFVLKNYKEMKWQID